MVGAQCHPQPGLLDLTRRRTAETPAGASLAPVAPALDADEAGASLPEIADALGIPLPCAAAMASFARTLARMAAKPALIGAALAAGVADAVGATSPPSAAAAAVGGCWW